MEGNTRYVIGYDLNDIQVQISYFELDNESPGTLVSDGENERLGVPTVLCKRKRVNQWSFGTEAQRLIMRDGEAEVNKLLSLALSGKAITIEGEDFNGIDLLILFVRKTLKLLSVYVSVEQIESFVFTVPKLDMEMLSVLERLSAAVPIERSRIMFQGYSEAVYCYMIHQPEELWDPECVIFDHDGKTMTAYHMHMNHRTTPIVGVIDKTEFEGLSIPDMSTYYDEEEDTAFEDADAGGDDGKASGTDEENENRDRESVKERPLAGSDDTEHLGNENDSGTEADIQDLRNARVVVSSEKEIDAMDEKLYNLIHEFLITRTVRSAYLLGQGFDGEWCGKTIRFLCMGRRVFQGSNMYSKGACYYGMDKLFPSENNDRYIFLGEDKLKFNLGIYIDRNGQEEYIALADGGENWFDISAEVEFLLKSGSKVQLIVTPLDGKEIRVMDIVLDGLPERPPKTTRLKLWVIFSSGNTVKAVVKDMGFGEIFQSSGLAWDKELTIE